MAYVQKVCQSNVISLNNFPLLTLVIEYLSNDICYQPWNYSSLLFLPSLLGIVELRTDSKHCHQMLVHPKPNYYYHYYLFSPFPKCETTTQILKGFLLKKC